ncbi:MAG: nitrate reductase subunit beta [Syntrophobacteraceae bacterium]
MKIKAQIAMVMNLDKCIGCHTCSIPCKNVWTNRAGAEYIWYNNVETKPGIGYPKKWEDQSCWKGGWTLKEGKLALAAGGRAGKLAKIFYNPDLPRIDDYYEPWTYNYTDLITSPSRKHQPSLRPKSAITGENMRVRWGPNWEDDLAGVNRTGKDDVNFGGLEHEIYLQFKNVFMLHLPRICEHCLNPSCVASCPSGAIYKRDEDGIVLVDQERCRGWRFCVSGCPYKKVYFNWKTGRSEKCIFCYPRIEGGMPTLCAETCVGRIRYIGVLLYDAEKIHSAAATPNDRDVYGAQTALFLDPSDPEVAAQAVQSGIPQSFVDAARLSPVYKLAVRWKLALPPHPEFRTLPMVWYIPPLSPMIRAMEGRGEAFEPDSMRIPMRYLANLLAAGDEAPVRLALSRLTALRAYMRSVHVDKNPDTNLLDEAGLTAEEAEEMYRLLAIAKYEERYVVPTVRREVTDCLHLGQGTAGYPSKGGS